MWYLNRKQKYKEKLKQTYISAQLVWSKSKISEGSPNGTGKTIVERICEADEYKVWSERSRE